MTQQAPTNTTRLTIVKYKTADFGFIVLTRIRDKTDTMRFIVYHFNPQTRSFGHGNYFATLEAAELRYIERN